MNQQRALKIDLPAYCEAVCLSGEESWRMCGQSVWWRQP